MVNHKHDYLHYVTNIFKTGLYDTAVIIYFTIVLGTLVTEVPKTAVTIMFTTVCQVANNRYI